MKSYMSCIGYYCMFFNLLFVTCNAYTISLGSHQNIGLHTGARANVVLYLGTYLLALIVYTCKYCYM